MKVPGARPVVPTQARRAPAAYRAGWGPRYSRRLAPALAGAFLVRGSRGGALRLRGGLALLRRGFSFAAGCALIARMDPDLENIIRQTLADAQAIGRDHMSQTVLAVQAVEQARPNMTAADALAAVNLVQHK